MEREAIVGALKRRWWIIVLLAALGGLVGALPSPAKTADVQASVSYTATASLDISSEGESIFSDPIAVQRLPLRATTGEVASRVEAKGFNVSLVQAAVDQTSFTLQITATSSEKGVVAPLVATVAEELKAWLAESQDNDRQARIEANLERLAILETEIDDLLRELAASPDDRVVSAKLEAKTRRYSVIFEANEELIDDTGRLVLTITDSGTEFEAIAEAGGIGAPDSRLGRGAAGAVAGLLLGIGVALLLGRLDRRMRSRQQVEAVFGMRAQVVIPLVSADRLQGIAVVADRHDALSDAYRTLRSVVGFVHAEAPPPDPKRGMITLVVSSSPGDGKTSVAANLSAAFVETGRRTVAVNTDFRRPTLSSRILGTKPTPVPLSVDEIKVASARVLLARTPLPGLALLDLAGVPASPGDLARESARMVDELATIAEELVIDSSPLGLTAEVLELVPKADVIVVVTRLGHTSITSATRSMEILRSIATAPLLLTIVGDTGERSSYGYYEYTGPAKPSPSETRKRWKRSDSAA